MDPIGYAVRQGFERGAARGARGAAVAAAESALASLRETRGRDVAGRLAGLGRAPCDLVRAMVAAGAVTGAHAAAVALSRWFSPGGAVPSARVVAATLDTLDRWEAQGAPELPAGAGAGADAVRARLEALDVHHARIGERAAMVLGARPRTIVQALSHWITEYRTPSDRVAAAILREIELEERAESLAAAAATRDRAEPSAPTGPANPGIAGGLDALLGR